MNTVAMSADNTQVAIVLSADAAEALMTALNHLTVDGRDDIVDEFENTWDALVDLFVDVDETVPVQEGRYNSKRFEFDPTDVTVYQR